MESGRHLKRDAKDFSAGHVQKSSPDLLTVDTLEIDIPKSQISARSHTPETLQCEQSGRREDQDIARILGITGSVSPYKKHPWRESGNLASLDEPELTTQQRQRVSSQSLVSPSASERRLVSIHRLTDTVSPPKEHGKDSEKQTSFQESVAEPNTAPWRRISPRSRLSPREKELVKIATISDLTDTGSPPKEHGKNSEKQMSFQELVTEPNPAPWRRISPRSHFSPREKELVKIASIHDLTDTISPPKKHGEDSEKQMSFQESVTEPNPATWRRISPRSRLSPRKKELAKIASISDLTDTGSSPKEHGKNSEKQMSFQESVTEPNPAPWRRISPRSRLSPREIEVKIASIRDLTDTVSPPKEHGRGSEKQTTFPASVTEPIPAPRQWIPPRSRLSPREKEVKIASIRGLTGIGSPPKEYGKDLGKSIGSEKSIAEPARTRQRSVSESQKIDEADSIHTYNRQGHAQMLVHPVKVQSRKAGVRRPVQHHSDDQTDDSRLFQPQNRDDLVKENILLGVKLREANEEVERLQQIQYRLHQQLDTKSTQLQMVIYERENLMKQVSRLENELQNCKDNMKFQNYNVS